jgi:hypothetical protein
LLFETPLVECRQPPVYQRIARESLQLEDLGLSHRRIAQKLGVTGKTVTKAISWQRTVLAAGRG